MKYKFRNLLLNAPLLTLLIAFNFGFNANGQTAANGNDNIPPIVPASPEAAALGKFGQIPVGYYRGIPDISVPLFTVKEGQIELPITLSYHSGGVKVEEMASWAGLGWALSAGGVITRSLKGLEDEKAYVGYRYYGDSARLYATNQLTSTQASQYLLSLFRQERDGQPDIYYFNFGGNSGKFFYTDSGQLVTSPRSDLKITYDDTNTGWVIIDGKGTKYYFFNRERTLTEPFCKAGTGSYSSNDQSDNFSGWYLSKIQDVLGDSVTFTYTNFTNTFKTKSIDTYNQIVANNTAPSCPALNNVCYNQMTVYAFRLKQITFSSGKIVFNPDTTARLDNTSDHSLQNVAEYDSQNHLIKSYNLYTGYFSTNTTGGCEDDVSYRLRLDSLQEIGLDSFKLSPYRFYYNTSYSLPCRLSNAQDYWGYYNGRSNTTFVRYQVSTGGTWQGANKEPDSVYAKAGILQKIVYPTGGKTEFTFESNTHVNPIPAGFNTNAPSRYISLSGDNSGDVTNYIDSTTTSFTLSSGDIPSVGYRYIKITFSKYCANPSLLNVFTMTISGDNGYHKTVHDGDTLHLTAAAYSILGTIETEDAGTPYCNFSLTLYNIPYNESEVYQNVLYGGLRIKQIQNFDEQNNPSGLQTFLYNKFDDNGNDDTVSSGQTSGVFSQSYYEYNKSICPIYRPDEDLRCCSVHVYNSTSNYPLLNTGGSPVAYKNVTVLYGPNGSNGKEQYTYTCFSDYPDVVGFSFPFFFDSEYDWRKGLLLKKTTYQFKDSTYSPVEKKMIVYDFHNSDTTYKTGIGVVCGKLVEYIPQITFIDLYDLSGLSSTYFSTVGEAFNIKSDTTIIYDRNSLGNFTTLINSYAYNPKNFQLQQQSTTNSKNEKVITNITYPLDYTITGTVSNSMAAAILNMQSNNAISTPVEKYMQLSNTDGSKLRTTSASFTTYKQQSLLPDISYRTENATTLAAFTPTSITNSSTTMDSTYKPQIYFDKYNFKGGSTQLHKINSEHHAYLWDYSNNYPVAQIINADSASVAYSSFEADGSGNWTISSSARDTITPAITGKKSYALSSGSISRSGLTSSSSYIVSYWSTNGSHTVTNGGTPKQGKTIAINGTSWTYYEHTITGTSSVTVSGSGNIDELRLYPVAAQMTTYTYAPLIGQTSQCDINNRITYFFYDKLGRLRHINDQDNNVIKKYDYQYSASH